MADGALGESTGTREKKLLGCSHISSSVFTTSLSNPIWMGENAGLHKTTSN